MELFKLRYNLYKLLIKDDFIFKQTLNKSIFFKNLSYIAIIFFIIIFIIGFEFINSQIIFFIIILILFIYQFELVLININNISNYTTLNIYANRYKSINQFFNNNYEVFINNINNNLLTTSNILTTGSITNVITTFGGVGYEFNRVYDIRFIQGSNSNAIGKIKGLRDTSLGNVNITNIGSNYNENDKISFEITDDINTNKEHYKPKFDYKISKINFTSNLQNIILSYNNLNQILTKNILYIDNIIEDEIDEYINLLRKENDILKYIDIYDKKYEFLHNYLFINKKINESIFNKINHHYEINKNVSVNNITISNIIEEIFINDTYLINLNIFYKNYDENNEYMKNIYSIIKEEYNIKDFNYSFNNNIKNELNILLNKFNISFLYLLIIIIIILTIVLHIFFIQFYRKILV